MPGESQAQWRAAWPRNDCKSACYKEEHFRPSGVVIAESAIMPHRMPSPIGHALAGVAIAWTADAIDGRRSSPRLVALSAGLAMLPDIDLLVTGTHRTASHSVAAAAVVFIVASLVTGKVTQNRQPHARWRVALVCTAAFASHLLLDWLGADRFPPRGIQLAWPFSDRWFISDLDIFRQTARQHFFTAPIIGQNIVAVVQEIAILVPGLALIWIVRRRHRIRN
jgi:inner membrane protein